MSSFVSKLSLGAGAISLGSAVHSLTKFMACNQCQKYIEVIKTNLVNGASPGELLANSIKSLAEIIPFEQLQQMGTDFLSTGKMPVNPCSDFDGFPESDLECGTYLSKTILATALVAGCVGLYCYSRKPARHPQVDRFHNRRAIQQEEARNRPTPSPAPAGAPARAPLESAKSPRLNDSSSPAVRRAEPDEESAAQERLEEEWRRIKNRWK